MQAASDLGASRHADKLFFTIVPQTLVMSADWIMPTVRRTTQALTLRPQGKERRRFVRSVVTVDGRILGADGREHPCRTLDVSPGSLRIATPAPLQIDEAVVMYCDDLGRLTGRVVRVAGDGTFGLTLDASGHKREKLAEVLTWLINGRDQDARQERRMPRTAVSGAAMAELDDGTQISVELVDFSVVGAAVRSKLRPRLGAWIKIGQQVGRVARYTDDGFAVDFQPRNQRAVVSGD